jgi:hypothetical protein
MAALCLAGCGAQKEEGSAGGSAAVDGGAGNLAAAALPPAPAGNEAAETPVGSCPFATRGWQAAIVPASKPGGTATVALNGEVRPDKGGRMPTVSTQGAMEAPALVLELSSDPAIDPQPDRGWSRAGAVFDAYYPNYTHAAVRCAGAEIARVPIAPAP